MSFFMNIVQSYHGFYENQKYTQLAVSEGFLYY